MGFDGELKELWRFEVGMQSVFSIPGTHTGDEPRYREAIPAWSPGTNTRLFTVGSSGRYGFGGYAATIIPAGTKLQDTPVPARQILFSVPVTQSEDPGMKSFVLHTGMTIFALHTGVRTLVPRNEEELTQFCAKVDFDGFLHYLSKS